MTNKTEEKIQITTMIEHKHNKQTRRSFVFIKFDFTMSIFLS